MSKTGLSAEEAARLVYEPPEEPEPPLRSDAQLFAGGFTYVDAEYDERLGDPRSEMQSALMEALRQDGVFRVKGYRCPLSPDAELEDVPDLWDVLTVDIETNTAEGDELRYVGLQFDVVRPAPFSSKADVDALYLEHCRKTLKETDRPPRIKDDEAWGKGKHLSRERVRILRKMHGTRYMTRAK